MLDQMTHAEFMERVAADLIDPTDGVGPILSAGFATLINEICRQMASKESPLTEKDLVPLDAFLPTLARVEDDKPTVDPCQHFKEVMKKRALGS